MSSDLLVGAHVRLLCYTEAVKTLLMLRVKGKRMYILLVGLLFLAALVYGLDAVAQDNFYYWIYWWYDIMMHFLGGFLVAGIALWLFLRFAPEHLRTRKNALFLALATGFLVGVGWELFEYFTGILQQQPGNIVGDTALDLVMDSVGALAVWGVASLFFVTNEKSLNEQVPS